MKKIDLFEVYIYHNAETFLSEIVEAGYFVRKDTSHTLCYNY